MPSSQNRLFAGIDLGGTNMQIGVAEFSGARDKTKWKLRGRTGRKTQPMQGKSAVIDRIVHGVTEACKEAGIKPRQLAGLGIGAPGAIDPHGGIVMEAVNLRWNDVPLARILSKRIGTKVVVDNDVNVAVYGEWKLGAARGHSEVLGVWMGTGIGGGLVLNNRLYEGGFFTAGEIGHMTMLHGAPLGRRSLEQNCSRTAVAERLAGLIRSNHKSILVRLSGGDFTQIRSKMIAQAYEAGDRLTLTVLDEAAEMLGIHIAGVVTLLSLPMVVLGGGLTEAVGEPWVREVRRSVHEHVFPARCRGVEVVASELEDDAGLVGAALLARDRLSR